MDSIEAKTQQLQTSLQSLYTSTGVQNLFKGILDYGNNIITTFTKMPTVFNLPLVAIAKFGTQFYSLANVVTTVFGLVKSRLTMQSKILQGQLTNDAQTGAIERVNISTNEILSVTEAYQNGVISYETYQARLNELAREGSKVRNNIAKGEASGVSRAMTKGGLIASAAGSALSLFSSTMGENTQAQRNAKGLTDLAGSVLSGVGTGMMIGGPAGAAVGALTVLPGLITSISTVIETAAEREERLKKAVEETNNTYLQRKDEAKTLEEQIEKLKELEKTQNDSDEAKKEFIELSNQMADQHPELITAIDSEGNAIVSLSESYNLLTDARKEAIKAAQETAGASYEQANSAYEDAKKNADEKIVRYVNNASNLIPDSIMQSSGEVSLKEILKGGLTGSGENLSNEELLEMASDYIFSGNAHEFLTKLFENGQFNISDLSSEEWDKMKEALGDYFDKYNSIIQQNRDNVLQASAQLETLNETSKKAIEALETGNSEELKKLLLNDDYTINEETLKSLQESTTEIQDIYTLNLINNLIELSRELGVSAQDAVKTAKIQEAAVRSGITRVSSEAMRGMESDYFEKMSGAMNFINEAIIQEAPENMSEEEFNKFLETVPEFVERYDKQLASIWNNLGSSFKQDKFNQLIENSKNYSSNQMAEELESLGLEVEQITNIVTWTYGEEAQSITNFNEAVKKRLENNNSKLAKTLESFSSIEMGEADYSAVLDKYDQLQDMVSGGAITDDYADTLLKFYKGLLNKSNNKAYSDNREQIQSAIQELDLTSLESANAFIEAMTEIGFLDGQTAKALREAVPVNLNTEVNTYVEKISSEMEDFESALSKATSGMKYKDTAAIAAKMGVSVDDFRQVGDKFFIDDLDALEKAYFDTSNDLVEGLHEKIQNLSEGLNNFGKIFLNDNVLKLDSFSAQDYFSSDTFKNVLDSTLQEAGVNVNLESLELESTYKQWIENYDEIGLSFVDYLIQQLTSSLEEAEKVQKVINTQKAESYLAQGNFTKFLENLDLDKEQRSRAQEAFNEGNLDEVFEIIPQYADKITETFKKINQDIYNRMISETGSDNWIKRDDSNKILIADLAKAGLIKQDRKDQDGNFWYKLEEITETNIQAYYDIITNDANLTGSEKATARAKATTELWNKSLNRYLQEAFKNTESVSQEVAEQLRTLLGLSDEDFNTIFDENGNNYIVNASELTRVVNKSSQEISDETQNMGNEAIQKTTDSIIKEISIATDLLSKGSTSAADIEKFVSDFNKVTGQNLTADQLFSFDKTLGTSVLDSKYYQQYVAAKKAEMLQYGATEEQVENYVDELTEKSLAAVVDIDSFLKAENREKGSQAYNKLTEQMRDFYAKLGYSQALIDSIVNQRMQNMLSGGNAAVQNLVYWAEKSGTEVSSSDVEQAYRAEIAQLENAFDQLSYGVGSLISGQAVDILEAAGYGIDRIEGTDSAVIKSINDVTKAYEIYYNELKKTGEATVAALNEAYAKVLETRDDSDVIAALGDAASMTSTRLGEILAIKGVELTDELLAQYSDTIQSIGGGKVRITNFDRFATEIMQWTDIDKNSEEYISAFKTYNDSLIDMNRKAERNIIEEVSKLNGASAGDWVNLTQLYNELTKNLIPKNYNGNVDLKHRPIVSKEVMQKVYDDYVDDYSTVFTTTFAAQLNEFDDNYIRGLADNIALNFTPIISATEVLTSDELFSYVQELVNNTDGSIEQIKQADAAAKNLFIGAVEVNGNAQDALAAATEQAIDTHELQASWYDLQYALQQAGAIIDDGILKINEEGANIPAIMSILIAEIQNSGEFAGQEEAELLDALNANLKSYSDALSNAIKGTASNVEIQKLEDWAESLNIQIDFTKTIDGLKISQDSAIKLYNELKKIDYLQSQLVFKELSDSLKENNSNYKDMSSILARIKTLEEEINNPNISTARREEYKRELELAKEIKETRALTDPDSFNFMSNDIPNAMKGAENYWNSWGNAFKAMNEAGESGYMGITDFYNIVNEMNNLAKMSGNTLTFMGRELSGDAKDAAKLIQEGMGYLANVDGGGVSVALKNFGSKFANGAADMQTGVKGGIKAMAQANIDMLDAMIQQLELVVAMENLKDLTGDDNKIDLSDLFPRFEKGDYTLDQEQKDAIQKIIDSAEENKDLEEALKKFEINGKSMNQWLNDAINGNIKNADDAKIFQATLAAFYDALQSGDWSPESIKENTIKYLQENIDAGSWAEFTLTDGTKVQVTHNGYLEEKDGKYYVNGGGQGYDSIEEAKEALDFALKTGLDGAFKNENGEMQKDYEIDQNNKVSVTQNIDGELEYQYNDGEKTPDKFKAINDAYEDYKQKSISEGDLTPQSFDEWVIDKKIIAKFNLTIEDVVQLNGKENIGELSDKILAELGIDVSLVRAVEAGIERAFSENGGGIGTALIEGIAAALKQTSFDDQTFTIPEIGAKPSKITVDTTGITPTFTSDSAVTKVGAAADITASILPTIPELKQKVKKITFENPEEIDSSALTTAATTVGQDVNAGLANGMSDTTSITEKATSNINTLIGTINTAAGVQAAGQGSTKTLQTGQDIVSGLTQGLGNIDSAITAGKTLVQQVIEAIQAYLDANPLTVTANVATKSEEKPRQKTSNTTTPASASVATPNFSGVQNALSVISNTATAVFNNIITKVQAISAAQDAIKTDKVEAIQTAQDSIEHNKVEDIKTAQEAIENTKVIAIQTAQDSITHNKVDAIQTAQNAIKNDKVKDIQSAQSEIKHNKVDDIKYAQESISTNKIDALKNAINNLGGTVSLGVNISVNVQGGSQAKGSISSWSVSRGGGKRTSDTTLEWNQHSAFAAGKDTLMGELGPELVVSHGRYFLVGQNGPEMVNLDDDAIVFNHLQTKKLIEKGKISSHGTPVTNERKATSMATGNFNGPAMASASETLAMLKQLREMWRSLLKATAKEIGAAAGKAGKTSKGSGADKTADETKATEKYTAGIESNVERWYNWLQAIEATQYKINKLTKEYNILEKEGVSTQERLNNLQQQYKLRQENKDTRERLVKEQTKYRNDVIDEANQGLMSAFYQADKKTGQVYLANDDAFQKFLQRQQARGLAAGELSSVLAQNGSIRQETEITRGLNKKEREAKAEEVVKNSYGRQNKVPSYLKQYYKNGTLIEGQEEEAKKAAAEQFKNSKYTKKIKTTREIKTGFDFMDELQAKDEAGNLIHDAEDQLALIKEMGLFTQDLMTGIDTETEGWEAQVVQRFYDKVEEDKEGIESLTESIRDQELAALDEAAAMQEINEKIRSLTAPIGGITKGLEKWYNETVKIKEAQQEINKLIKEMTLLQKDQKINGKEIYENYKKQQESLHKQIAENESFMAKRKKEAAELAKKYGDLPIEIDERGAATFSDRKIGVVNGYGSINTSYTRSKTIKVGDREYYVDTEGNYRDDQGILRNKNGQQIEGSFGQQAVETVTGHQAYNFSGKTIQELVKDLTSKDAYGNWNFQGEEVFQILETAGLGKYMQYDENGNKIYDNLGELTPEEMQKAAQAAVTRLQTAVTEINQNNDEIVNLDEENLKLQSDLLAIDQALIDNQIEVENMVKEAVIQEHQDAIDTKKELKDALDDAATRTIDGLRESLDQERSMYDKAENQQQLATLQRQLEVAQRSGASLSRIQSLQDQVASTQKDMYFTEREELIDNIENSMQREIEALDTQISIMEATLEFQKENGLLWAEINQILAGTPASIIDYIIKKDPDHLSQSETERAESLVDIGDKVETYAARRDDDKRDTDEKFEQLAEQVRATQQQQEEDQTEDTGDVYTPQTDTPTTQTTQQQQQQQDEEEGTIELTFEDGFVPEIEELGADFDATLDLGTKLVQPEGMVWDDAWETNRKRGYNESKEAYGIKPVLLKAKKLAGKKLSNQDILEAFKARYTRQLMTEQDTPAQIAKQWNSWNDEQIKKVLKAELKKLGKTVPKFEWGGDIDFTGLARVDGTKNEPEHIFNFQQMEALRAHLLNGVDVTRQAISGLSEALNQMPNVNTYNDINNTTNSGISINTLEFHMEVSEIANDYDARRAGEQAMNEIVRIARKSGTRSLSRR